MKPLVAAKESEKRYEIVEEFLSIAGKRGYKTSWLTGEENAPNGSIAVYSGKSYLTTWPGRFVRMAAHRLSVAGKAPDWALTTPFLVAVRTDAALENRRHSFECSVQNCLEHYRLWLEGRTGTRVPWDDYHRDPPVSFEYEAALQRWYVLVQQALPVEVIEAIFSSSIVPEHLKGCGGDVVFNHLIDTGRVLTQRSQLPFDLRTNGAYKRLVGLNRPPVIYGTSDAANVFETLQALKLGDYLGLPVAFQTYPGAHDFGYWRQGFLEPSLGLLGIQLDFGLEDSARYRDPLDQTRVRDIFTALGITDEVDPDAFRSSNLGEFYQHATHQLVRTVSGLLGLSVPFVTTTTEELLKQTPYWRMKATDFAKTLQAAAGHQVVAFNGPNNIRLVTKGVLQTETVEELHQQGYWLGGAGIYRLIFSLGQYGGLVAMVKDSRAGRVNFLARPYLTQESSLYLVPVGLFRLCAEGQNEDWSIDPWVFLALLKRWGFEKAQMEVRKIWNAMEVPLDKRNIGRKTVATVTAQGISITVSQL